jgi:hypothetical protein
VILHAGVLALIAGSAAVFVLAVAASMFGFRILRNWDFQSSSARQLSLERKTYLVSTLVNYALGLEVISIFIFVYTAEDIHPLFTGAMCATGALNANPVGWYVLGAKLAVFFLGAVWITLNSLDQRAEDYPLVKLKYGLLLALTPLVAIDVALEVAYFWGLSPNIITSCCGALFSESGDTVASTLAALPPGPTAVSFYVGALVLLSMSCLCLRRGGSFMRYALSVTAAVFFFVALAAVVSYVSPYIYELPTHHCPFDMLQAGYHFIGYPLYAGLLGGTLLGILPGIFQPLGKVPSLKATVSRLQRKWIIASIIFILIFVAIASYPVFFGNLTMDF